MSACSSDSQTCPLPDGRVLGFAEYGDPAGHPLLYFHGFPSSRLEASVAHAAAWRNGLRLLALDRPGCGLSTPQSGRHVADWAEDVRAFGQQQQLSRFAIVGFSGGGPYALACACRLPASMLTGVGVMAGAGPFDDSADSHIPRRLRITLTLFRCWPSGVRLFLAGQLSCLRWFSRTRLVTWLLKGLEDDGRTEAKHETEEMPSVRRGKELRLFFETFAQDAEGMLEDGIAFSEDFGFRYEDVAYDPVQFWHGDNDRNVPLEWVRPMIAKVPHAIFKVYEGKTHFGLMDHLDEMLAGLVPKEDDGQHPTASSAVTHSTHP